jgi:uncharacterized protein
MIDESTLVGVAVIVLAKYPAAGRVKTRLIPAIGAEAAAKVHACCLLHVVRRLQMLQPRELIVCFDPPEQQEPMRGLLESCGAIALCPQTSGDLGRRIADAAGNVAQRHRRSLLLAVDSPDVPADSILAAAQATSDAQVVLGLADDGGYWCIGLRDDVDPRALLHEGIEWSSDRTAADTVARARQLGYSTWTGEPWDDLDRPADLKRLMARIAQSSDAEDRALYHSLAEILPGEFVSHE